MKEAEELKDGGHRGWKRQRRVLPRAPEGASPAHTPIPDPWSPEVRENKCLLFSTIMLWFFIMEALENSYSRVENYIYS